MHNTESHEALSFTRIGAAAKRTGLSRSYLYALSAKGDFPPIIKISERASAVVTAELDRWIKDKIKAAGAGQSKSGSAA